MVTDQAHTAELLEILSGHGLAASSQRLALLATIRASEGVHASADDLYRSLADQFPTLSRATVYNNLAALANAGIIEKLDTPDGSRYGPVARPHVNLICQRCGEIEDVLVDDADLVGLIARAAGGSKFQATSVSMSLSGTCARCE